MYSEEFRRCLVDLDVVGIRRLWSEVFEHLPQPSSDQEILHTLHLARTKAESIPFRLKLYSKQWLKEHQISKIVSAVGISVNAPSHRLAEAEELHEAMKDSVLASIQSGISLANESQEIYKRMQQAREQIKDKKYDFK